MAYELKNRKISNDQNTSINANAKSKLSEEEEMEPLPSNPSGENISHDKDGREKPARRAML
jgi:hypothetical protein